MRPLARSLPLVALLLTLAHPSLAGKAPAGATVFQAAQTEVADEDRAALEDVRALLAELKDDETPAGEVRRTAANDRLRVLESLVQTIEGRAALPDPEAMAARAAELRAELDALRAEELPSELKLTATSEQAKYEQASKAAAAELVSAQSAVDALATRTSEGEKELLALPDRSDRARARSEGGGEDDELSRYIVGTARFELRLVAERAAYLTQALAAWESQAPVLQLELDRATLRASRAKARAELAAAEASRLREIESATARREADAEARRAAREKDPLERFRFTARSEAANLRATSKDFETRLGELDVAKARENELVKALEEERKGLNQRLELRQRGSDILLRQHRDRCERSLRLIADITLPELDAALEANEVELAETLDRLWHVRLPPEENEVLAELIAEVGDGRAAEARAVFEASLAEDGLLEALEHRADQLEDAGRSYGELLRTISERRKVLAAFEDYISGRMLWTRSAPPIDGAALTKAWSELARVPVPYREDGTWARFRQNCFDKFPAVLLALGAILGLHFLTRKTGRWRDAQSSSGPWVRHAVRAGTGLLWALGPPLQLAIGWHLAAIGVAVAAGTRSGSSWTRGHVADVALWIGLLAVYIAAGTLDLALIDRACIAGPESRFGLVAFATGYPGPGLSPAAVAAAGFVTAVVMRVGVWPALALAGDATRGDVGSRRRGQPMMLVLAVLTLLRFDAVLGLAPGVRVVLVLFGAVFAVLVAAAAMAELNPDTAPRRLGRVFFGLTCVAAGMGGWSAAVLVAVSGAFVWTALELSERAAGNGLLGRSVRGVASGVIPGGPMFACAGVLLVAVAHVNPVGIALNTVAAVLVVCALLLSSVALARTAAAVRSSRSPPANNDGDGIDGLAWVPVTVAVGAGVLAIPGVFRPVPVLSMWLRPITAVAASYPGIYATGLQTGWSDPSASVTLTQLLIVCVLVVALVGLGGLLLARSGTTGRQLTTGTRWILVRLAFVPKLGQRLVAAFARGSTPLVRYPIDRFVARVVAAASDTVAWIASVTRHRGPLILALATALVLAHVYMNPKIATLGPTRVHPVDLGGLAPAIVRPRSLQPKSRAAAQPSADTKQMQIKVERGNPEEMPGL